MFNTLSTNWEIVIKLVTAVLLGGALGIQRTLSGKTAGMRTYALVSMGSALFIIIFELVSRVYIDAGLRALDPVRSASQLVLGVGFLGAGLIIFQDHKLSGLTTAAGLWVCAGIGMAVGYGFYTLGLLVTAITFLVFTVFWSLEEFLLREFHDGNSHDQS